MAKKIYKSNAFYKFFCQPPICSFLIDTFIFLSGPSNEIRIDFNSFKQITVIRGLLFYSLIITTNGNESYKIPGLSRSDAEDADYVIKHVIITHQVDCLWPQITMAIVSWRALTSCDHYVTHSMYQSWKNDQNELNQSIFREMDLMDFLDREKKEIMDQLKNAMEKGRELIDAHNEEFVGHELIKYRPFFDDLERYPLTSSQRLAVLHDEDNNLVLAGAGTGKTSTIMAKVGYLLSKGLASADSVLLLAFTKKAAEEMRERIELNFKTKLNVRTFHSLGLEVISRATGNRPSLCREAEDVYILHETLKRIVAELQKEDLFRQKYISFQVYYRVPYRPAWEFETLSDYTNYLRSNNLRSLSGDLVKSFEECMISNWLYMNGIAFEYEKKYEVDVSSISHRQYKPDFYLTDYGIYIEHFAIDKQGRTPRFINQVIYTSSIDWKRELHKDFKTILIETYSWQHKEGILLAELERKLRKAKVKFKPLADSEVLDRINALGQMDPVVNLLATFQSLFKGSGFNLEDIYNRARQSGDVNRAITFLDIFDAVNSTYERGNREKGNIDFDDMIATALSHVVSGQYKAQFKYILVDEFQDISLNRAKLLQAIRDQVPGGKLFCVGDDWQSIYRFTGSDISIMTNFRYHFGYTKQTNLDRTFRFNNKIEMLSSQFVLRNPNQIIKKLVPHENTEQPCIFVCLRQKDQNILGDILKDILHNGSNGGSVFVLTRYNFQIPTQDMHAQIAAQYPQFKISYLTAHSSKGLEADYVIVDKLNCGRYGFPTEINDDPLLDLALPAADPFENGEERRLFYVAVTRARKRLYLVADPAVSSSFIRELLAKKNGYDINVWGDIKETPAPCPSCESGFLIPRTHEARNALFYGCSNYPLCSYAEDACPKCGSGPFALRNGKIISCVKCGHTARLCPRCHRGRLVTKHGRHGDFYGCTMYSSEMLRCTYTENAHSKKKKN